MNINRIKQVGKYGWIHAGQVTVLEGKGYFFRLKLFFDIILCFYRYKMWSNQYLKEKFWSLSGEERKYIGQDYREKGKARDDWQKDFQDNRRFLFKYTSRKYELPNLRDKRNKAYAKRYNMGTGVMVEYNVELSRQHYLRGTISIGKNVLLAKNVFIDYSGEVVIKDDVRLTNGVIIETHNHGFHSDYRCDRSDIFPTKLLIEEGVVVGSRAVILSSCHRIGKHARIGAGAVITKDVPDYAIVVGVPGRIVRYMQNGN